MTALGNVASSQAPPWPKNRLRIRPTDARLVWGPISAERASDSLKPSVGHLAAKPRNARIGDRTHMRRTARPSLCELLRAGREPTKHPLGEGRRRSDAILHGLIVHTAEPIVPPPMHPLRFVRKDIKNAKLAAQLFSNFLRLED